MPLALALLSAAWGACPDVTVGTHDISRAVDESLSAFSAMDEAGFLREQESALTLLGCADEVLLPPDAAALHRVSAVRAFYDGSDTAAEASFRAALRIEPRYAMPDAIAAPGSPLDRVYEAARLDPAPPRAALPAFAGTPWVDGSRAADRPTDVPWVLQVVATDGAVLWSGRLSAGEDAPAALVQVPSKVEGEPEKGPVSYLDEGHLEEKPRKPIRVSGPMLGTGLALVAAGGGLWGASAVFRGQYQKAEDRGDVDKARAAWRGNHATYVAGISVAGTGLVLGAVSFALPVKKR